MLTERQKGNLNNLNEMLKIFFTETSVVSELQNFTPDEVLKRINDLLNVRNDYFLVVRETKDNRKFCRGILPEAEKTMTIVARTKESQRSHFDRLLGLLITIKHNILDGVTSNRTATVYRGEEMSDRQFDPEPYIREKSMDTSFCGRHEGPNLLRMLY